MAAMIQNTPTVKSEKDHYRENTPSNKTQALTKSMNMNIWVIGTFNVGLSPSKKVVLIVLMKDL